MKFQNLLGPAQYLFTNRVESTNRAGAVVCTIMCTLLTVDPCYLPARSSGVSPDEHLAYGFAPAASSAATTFVCPDMAA